MTKVNPPPRPGENCRYKIVLYYKYSFFPLAIVQWNALPESVVSLQDLEAFKVAVSKLQHSKP